MQLLATFLQIGREYEHLLQQIQDNHTELLHASATYLRSIDVLRERLIMQQRTTALFLDVRRMELEEEIFRQPPLFPPRIVPVPAPAARTLPQRRRISRLTRSPSPLQGSSPTSST